MIYKKKCLLILLKYLSRILCLQSADDANADADAADPADDTAEDDADADAADRHLPFWFTLPPREPVRISPNRCNCLDAPLSKPGGYHYLI